MKTVGERETNCHDQKKLLVDMVLRIQGISCNIWVLSLLLKMDTGILAPIRTCMVHTLKIFYSFSYMQTFMRLFPDNDAFLLQYAVKGERGFSESRQLY